MKLSDIAQFDGKEERPCHIVYKGKVYDVSKSERWLGGIHFSRHHGGEDLTEFISMAPHGPEVLERFEVVGEVDQELDKEIDFKEKCRRWYHKFHPHPILLHYPMGVLPFGALSLLIYLLSGELTFEAASFYALVFATLSIYPVAIAGIFSWWVNYEMMATSIFQHKLFGAGSAILFCTAALILRLVNFGSEQTGMVLIVYCLLYFMAVPCMFIAAYEGGKITWPS